MSRIFIAHYWLAAAHSGFVLPEQWQRWADRIIEKNDETSNWIIELSLVQNKDEMAKRLQDIIFSEWKENGEAICFDEEVEGYLYIRYEKGELTLPELLKTGGELADSGGVGEDCEAFYELLTKYEILDAKGADTLGIENATKELFKEYREIAAKQ